MRLQIRNGLYHVIIDIGLHIEKFKRKDHSSEAKDVSVFGHTDRARIILEPI